MHLLNFWTCTNAKCLLIRRGVQIANIIVLVYSEKTINCSVDDYLQVSTKRKRELDPDDMSRGAARARKFLKDFSELPLDSMDLNGALEHVNKLRNELEKDAVNSQWLQQFF